MLVMVPHLGRVDNWMHIQGGHYLVTLLVEKERGRLGVSVVGTAKEGGV